MCESFFFLFFRRLFGNSSSFWPFCLRSRPRRRPRNVTKFLSREKRIVINKLYKTNLSSVTDFYPLITLTNSSNGFPKRKRKRKLPINSLVPLFKVSKTVLISLILAKLAEEAFNWRPINFDLHISLREGDFEWPTNKKASFSLFINWSKAKLRP